MSRVVPYSSTFSRAANQYTTLQFYIKSTTIISAGDLVSKEIVCCVGGKVKHEDKL